MLMSGLIIVLTFFGTKSSVFGVLSDRTNRDTQTARDRVAILCDPTITREARGVALNCPPTPTQSQQPTSVPTNPPGPQATVTPTIGAGANPTPTSQLTQGGGGSNEDPCASGKSFSGPYCGWSPGVGGGSGSSTGVSYPRIGGPQVLGLSYTGGSDLSWSDIILLTGVLCLALYVRSKLEVRKLI